MKKNDDQFVADLEQSHRDANQFVQQQRTLGWDMTLKPLHIRPNYNARNEYLDDGDIIITARIEHKRRTNLNFTSRETYKYDTVIIDEKHKIDRAETPALMYVIQNNTKTHVGIIYAWTRKHWTTITRWDPIAKRNCDFYVIPKQYVRFCQSQEAFGT